MYALKRISQRIRTCLPMLRSISYPKLCFARALCDLQIVHQYRQKEKGRVIELLTIYLIPIDFSLQIPKGCNSLHHEVELGVVTGKHGNDIPETKAMDYISGYLLALDMTARDFQDEAKNKGQPWSLAKGFDTSCPVSEFIDKSKVKNPEQIGLWLKVNNTMRQNGNTKDMIFSVPYLISYISQYFTLEVGDVILTGTPSGVGPVTAGDVIEAGLSDLVSIKFEIEKRGK